MLAVTVVQIAFAVSGLRLASMGFERDVRPASFHRVTGFSAREVNAFGAPSLITRITNDVQQVQMLPFLTLSTTIDPSTPAFAAIWRIGSSAARRMILTPY
jgi:ATP-binding cassette subfamily B protein